MSMTEPGAQVAQFLTNTESAELDRLRTDPSVRGFALMTRDGEELEAQGVWDDTIAALANIHDLVDRAGEEIGEEQSCSLAIFDNGALEVSSVALGGLRAVLVRSKGARAEEVLRSVR